MPIAGDDRSQRPWCGPSKVVHTIEAAYDHIYGDKPTASSLNMWMYMPTLRKYAEKCKTVTEFGLETGNSAIAFLAAKGPEKVTSYDVRGWCSNTEKFLKGLKGVGDRFSFIKADTTKMPPIERTDLLFIDAGHTYKNVKAELSIHAKNVNKYIIFHDTIACCRIGPAIDEFLRDRKDKWEEVEACHDGPGLLVIERIGKNADSGKRQD